MLSNRMTTTAVLYLRSSKDRSEVSIQSQRRELTQFAEQRGLTIAGEYVDVVESARSEHRPGFQQLIADLKRPSRAWSAILAVEHSRIMRDRFAAYFFDRECEDRGVQVIYSKVPEVDPISQVMLDSFHKAWAEVHSLMSREKGLAGMRENVMSGYRAGGRAPWGYRLVQLDTGAVRDGEPVHKSRLEPDGNATLAAKYLQARAAGRGRSESAHQLGIKREPTTLIGTEWQALTYAGHTVWNMHHPRKRGGRGSAKRRPRSEWVIRRNTHEALITDAEAEAVLAQLEHGSVHRVAATRWRKDGTPYLLTGFLTAPDGTQWTGQTTRANERHYRLQTAGGSRYIPMEAVDSAVGAQVLEDLRSEAFLGALLAAARKANPVRDNTKAIRQQVLEVNRRIARTMELAARMQDPDPALRSVQDLERQRKTLIDDIEAAEEDRRRAEALHAVTLDGLRATLDALLGKDPATMDHAELRELVRSMATGVTLDPDTLDCAIHYAVPVQGVCSIKVAFPRGHDSNPTIQVTRRLRIAARPPRRRRSA